MSTVYSFVCDPDECDALVEFHARDGFGYPNGVVEMKCPCGKIMQYIQKEEYSDQTNTIR
jgi:hypothetical protein